MKVLITGASGMIGSALAIKLRQAGHQLISAGRRPVEGCEFLAVDFGEPQGEEWWAERLRGVDAVINSVGILRERRNQRFDSLHTKAPIALFQGAKGANVGCVVQISALGADDQATTAYHLSKRAADDALRGLGIAGAIVQPSLVYAPGGPSAALFNMLAMLPVIGLPRCDPLLQPVHISDLTDGIAKLLDRPPAEMPTIAFVGPEPLSMSSYIHQLRELRGIRGRAWKLYVPDKLCLFAGRLAGLTPNNVVDEDNIGMLLRGNAADAGPFTALLGHAPRGVKRFNDA